ncbi:sacsin N-terminal ATP-binding-like domain-containing protein [Mariniflexile sp. AS56]|uniref:sacsin N-terminal ATP-binding-like domain-containing protein n=1 Tax=Mariniflexile sp. AS56 TaxID=3063957 RepID=UPI0026EF7648|nr:ATP-binding protein [Mariniflexile sp. AS56]MDO7173881.1 ATP-binding protein [Mariniflexile sp. AS56]
MTNYIERLKDYWKSKDLIFIATYTKHKGNSGFFNHFTNPESKMRLYYPEFDGVEIIDKRVSFYYNNDTELIDGNYYKVELEFIDKTKGKNNPYSLSIKKTSGLNQNKIKKFLEKKNIEASTSTTYFGGYHKTNETFAAFENVVFSESGEVLMHLGESQKVFVSPSIVLEEGAYYTFSIKENKGKLPNAIPTTIEKLTLNPYQDYIRLRFERLNNPEANKMIANLMREIGKGMYSSKQRMIFELLQNADDAPGKEKVEFHIDINGDYFFVMHDGAPFNKDDVEAITSAAESTKRGDNKKTGYKGIGFKSVFTDSSEVWLKSGGYQFAFLRNSSLFENFDKFYFGSERYKKYPELLEEDKLKYRNQRLRFNGSTDIPWQVIPIWHNKLPNEFNDSNFNNFNNPVQFALKLGEDNIEEYKTAIDNITKRPQFLLFLRNTSKFRSPKNGVTVLRNDIDNVIEIIKSQRGEINQTFQYTKHTFENIEVSDEAFLQLNIGLKKQSKINDYNEVTHYFTDLDGREIETIPPKLASVKETEISFGISLIDGKITPEKEYLKEFTKYSSLFTYLPMEDIRFQLPFLVNADFVPSSDRQNIQGDNLWNKYIMIKVAEKHVATLYDYATEFITDNNLYRSYLSLLLKNTLPEDNTAQSIIDSYNEKYLEQLNILSIVVNDKNTTQLLSETIIDNSGFVELFGHDLFYKIIETDKRLPHINLDTNYLKNYDYLEVEIIELEELANHITPEFCEQLGVTIAEKLLYEKPELLKWLDELISHTPNYFEKIPFIVHNNSLFSLERLIVEEDAWIINKNTFEYLNLIKGLGYHTVNLKLNEYTYINNFLLSFNGYINDKTLAYERISKNSKLPILNISLKLKLIDFLQNSEFMVGIGETKYFNELRLFVDDKRKVRPLRQLISRQEDIEIATIQKFRINEAEFNNLSDALKKELITKNEVFASFILDRKLFNEYSEQFSSQNIEVYVSNLKTIFSWKNENEEILQSKWADIPWLFVDDETRFLTCDKVYWSNAFPTMFPKDYELIKAILHQVELKTLPLQECGVIIQVFKLKTNDSTDIDWTKINDLKKLSANSLLDWMENDGSFSDFFEQYTLKVNDNSLWSISEIENTQIFDSSNEELSAYINSNKRLKTLFTELDKSLCSDDRNKIGLLQGDKLLTAIIQSKAFDQNLAIFLPSSISSEQLKSFILNLTEFNLKTDVEYNSNTPEHIIIYHLLRIVEDINAIPEETRNTIDILRDKIKINQNPLSNYDLSNRIQFGKGDDKMILNLSDVLEEFKGESDVLDKLIDSFGSIKEKAKLRKLIFKTRRMSFNDICAKIEAERNIYYSEYQVVFQLLYKKYVGQQKWTKVHFDDFLKKQEDQVKLQSSYQSFLDIIFELDFTELKDFNFLDLNLENCLDKSYAIKSEFIPPWLEEWVVIDQNNRAEFITKLGYNGINSSIVKLRQAIISENIDSVMINGHYAASINNSQVIWNTLKWLSSFNSKIITRNIELIKQINNDVQLEKDDLEDVVIPIIETISLDGNKVYRLQKVPKESKLYLLNDNEEFAHSIFTEIKNENKTVLFIDGSSGNISKHFDTEVVKLIDCINEELLTENSNLWQEPFYKKWEYGSEYPIYIYNGNEIPYLLTFNNSIISKFTSDLKVTNDGKYYVSSILKKDVLDNLPSGFPDNMLANLKDWHYKTLQNDTLLDEDSFDYKEDIDRLLQDRLGISEEDQRKESGNAKTHAVYFLEENGFDISKVNNVGSALTNIIDLDGNIIDCIVRSAKGGLLYLDKEHWDMLKDDHTYLIVIYPGNSPRLFKNRLELLKEELAENVLFRIPNNKNTIEIDGVFKALESEPHIILVTSEKMKENLFSKLKQKRNFNKEENGAVGGDDFTL